MYRVFFEAETLSNGSGVPTKMRQRAFLVSRWMTYKQIALESCRFPIETLERFLLILFKKIRARILSWLAWEGVYKFLFAQFTQTALHGGVGNHLLKLFCYCISDKTNTRI